MDKAVQALLENDNAITTTNLINLATEFKMDLLADHLLDQADLDTVCQTWIARHNDQLVEIAQKYMVSQRFTKLLQRTEEQNEVSDDYDADYQLTAAEQAWTEQKTREYRAKMQAWFNNKAA